MFRWILLFAALVLAGCQEDKPKVNADVASPEYAAGEFFHALYTSKNLSRATKLATESYARVLSSYGSTRSITNTLYNMSFDEVTISIDRTGKNLREQYGDEAEVTLLFEGKANGGKKIELRIARMIKVDGKWKVAGVKPNPFSRTDV
ncbi:hypothetical protein ACFO3I_15310 [Rheinheimera marina]|uniref:DUF4878 domain-containing protein n=1 Tax=Rheinheimera marina TaxID=1774958 RepID=A0ABV9JQG6_9GAMM